MPEIRSIADLLCCLIGSLDARDVAIVAGSENHKGFACLLPDGVVKVRLEYGGHVPLTTADPVVSDQYPGWSYFSPDDDTAVDPND